MILTRSSGERINIVNEFIMAVEEYEDNREQMDIKNKTSKGHPNCRSKIYLALAVGDGCLCIHVHESIEEISEKLETIVVCQPDGSIESL